MKGYSLRRMRKEYGGVLRLLLMGFSALMLSSALSGAVLKACHAGEKTIVTAALLSLIAAALCLGAYLIVSDEKRLLRKTAYGRALARLGDAEALMREIDREAGTSCEEYGSFALLHSWLMVYYPDRSPIDPYRVCCRPIPRKAVRFIGVVRQDGQRGAEERTVRISCEMGQFDFPFRQTRDLDALRRWMEKREPDDI